MRGVIGIALALLASPCQACTVGDLEAAVMACSNQALGRYATTSPDPASAIADAAFEACRDAWNAAVDAVVGEDPAKADPKMFEAWKRIEPHDRLPPALQEQTFRLEGSRGARSGFKGAYTSQAVRVVFELRALAAGK